MHDEECKVKTATPYYTCSDCKFFYRVPKQKLRVGYSKEANYKQICFKMQCGVAVFKPACEHFVLFKDSKNVQ